MKKEKQKQLEENWKNYKKELEKEIVKNRNKKLVNKQALNEKEQVVKTGSSTSNQN